MAVAKSWSMSDSKKSSNFFKDMLSRNGTPDIFNTDQGRQFIRAGFTGGLSKNGIAIRDRIAKRDPFGSLWSAKAPILDRTWRDPDLA